jgi:carbon monoxide dehydrogenase subunit G
MATIRQEMILRTDPAKVWDAVRDVGAIHTRLAPGFVSNVEMDGDARIVTFANGRIVREEIVTVDDAAHRLVWSVVGTQMTHHNGSIQIFPEGGGCRLVWIADVLPNALSDYVSGMMQQGMEAMKKKLEADASAQAA